MKSIAMLAAPLMCIFAMGCDLDPEETTPAPEHTPLTQGAWQFHLGDPIQSGSCDIDFSGMDGLMLPGVVRTPGPHRVRIDLDGVVLNGERGDGLLMASGFTYLESGSAPDKPMDDEPDEEWTDESDGEDEGGSPPPCDSMDEDEPDSDVAEPAEGMSIYLDADVTDPAHVQGEMDIQVTMEGSSCSVNLQVVGRYVGETDSVEPNEPETEVVEVECG